MKKVLFVCTGNVFRSMSAEFAMRAAVTPDLNLAFESAGTHGYPDHHIRKDVLSRLANHNIDASSHRSKRLTKEIIESADLVVAMSTDHQKFIKEEFNHEAVLYLDICDGNKVAFPDLWEVIPDYKTNKKAASAFIDQTIDTVVQNQGKFMSRLPEFLKYSA